MDETYEPPPTETRNVYGISLQQHRNDVQITPKETFSSIITPKDSPPLPDTALRDLTVATIALKYTQSNSVCYALNGQGISHLSLPSLLPLYLKILNSNQSLSHRPRRRPAIPHPLHPPRRRQGRCLVATLPLPHAQSQIQKRR